MFFKFSFIFEGFGNVYSEVVGFVLFGEYFWLKYIQVFKYEGSLDMLKFF